MGLIIGITACCCAYCVIKKKRKKQQQKRLRDGQDVDQDNDFDLDDAIPARQSMIEDDTENEMNASDDVMLNKQIGMDSDRPPPYGAESIAMGTVLQEVDEHAEAMDAARKHSSKKKHKYAHLEDAPVEGALSGESGEEEAGKMGTTKSNHSHGGGGEEEEEETSASTNVNEVIIDRMPEIEEEDFNAGGVAGKSRSSGKHKYSPLKAAGQKEKKRNKSGESQTQPEEVSLTISLTISSDVSVEEPAVYV